jgi:hypothetical protein
VLVAPEHSYDKKLEDASWMTDVYVSRNTDEWPDLLRGVSKRNAGRRVELVMEAEHATGGESLGDAETPA